MAKPLRIALLGAGDRGMYNFGRFALKYPHLMKIVAVAEPDIPKRNRFIDQHQLNKEQIFETWQELLDKPKMADALINATPDQIHYTSTLRALEQGYHVLLEKPIATTVEDVFHLVQKAKETDLIFQICFEMRYTPFFSTIKQLIDSGEIGELIMIEHKESLIYWHMAHSFVRGNWRRTEESCPMLLAKTCHDFDQLTWLVRSPCTKVSSFGGLNYFREENSPAGSPDRCIDGCPVEDSCPYSAMKIYLGDNTDWPTSVISVDSSIESRMNALKNGPYGRCVFKCDNDVVDNQVVNMEFENSVRVSFVMVGHSHENTRTIRYSGNRGTLRGHFEKSLIEINDYNSGQVKSINTATGLDKYGHGGGDDLLIRDFLVAVKNGIQHNMRTSIDESVEGHLIIFAAEKSRKEGVIVDMEAFKSELKNNTQNLYNE